MNPTIVDWYVDKGTYRLLRRIYATGGNAGYAEVAAYTAFNAGVTINPPKE
jgi:hypothetical protein